MYNANTNNRRFGARQYLDMPVTKMLGDDDFCCWVSDISPTGIRLSRRNGADRSQNVCNLELHLVPGSISTVMAARRVWHDDDFEAYEFVSPTFAQQAMLERMVGDF